MSASVARGARREQARRLVAIATRGCGDITPSLPFAQMLVVSDAMLGRFDVAVVIAWLVSMNVSRRQA